MKIVECVPNFSEGRDRAVIDAIVGAITSVEGVQVLDVDPGRDTNRTVVTFVTPVERAVEAAFRGIAKAAELIDMAKHRGEHPRMGATDVCPFVPLGSTTMEECVTLARSLGERVGKDLGIPVYLYEYAATHDDRRNLASIREGEYEGLPEKLTHAHWQPDFGPAKLNARSGATVIGARKFLIAYNVNLNTRDKKRASDIAFAIREQGRKRRDEHGRFIRDMNGDFVYDPGTLKACKAVGWYIDEYQRAQVSINLTDFDVTPPHVAFEEVARQAAERGLRATGSELVGLVPLEAMRRAGVYYLEKQGASVGAPEPVLVETAIQSLGLRELGGFDPMQKIIEYRVANESPLASSSVREFVDLTSTDAPVPGGGSVAALCGSLAASLTAMVANLTFGKKGYESVSSEMSTLAAQAQSLKDEFLRAVDDDARAFDAVMAANRLPKTTHDEIARREEAVQAATQRAIDVPLSVMHLCEKALPLVERVAEKGNKNSISDAGVAALVLGAAARGAWLNVLINLPGLSDRGEASRIQNDGLATVARVAEGATRAADRVTKSLAP
ncbi:MAG: glutamate formimidoyltransferase [Candidatus Latescibacteria bacterium]|nr:glutamate formimidoyltransferase [Candidatus Latescibacterota bacterium]